MLNKAEMRLLAEWIDTGGKYYNDPFAPGSGVRQLGDAGRAELRQASIYPILTKTCAGCHQAFGSDGATTTDQRRSTTIDSSSRAAPTATST